MIKRRKSTSHAQTHNKSVEVLKKAGLTGLLITGNDQRTFVSIIGKQEKAFANTHIAIAQTPWLKEIAELSSGPKITMYKEKKDYLGRILPPDFQYTVTEDGDNVNISLNGEYIVMSKEVYEKSTTEEIKNILSTEFDLFKQSLSATIYEDGDIKEVPVDYVEENYPDVAATGAIADVIENSKPFGEFLAEDKTNTDDQAGI